MISTIGAINYMCPLLTTINFNNASDQRPSPLHVAYMPTIQLIVQSKTKAKLSFTDIFSSARRPLMNMHTHYLSRTFKSTMCNQMHNAENCFRQNKSNMYNSQNAYGPLGVKIKRRGTCRETS